MISKKLTLAAALIAASTMSVYAQSNSSNPSQAPSGGAASSAGGTAQSDSPGPKANVPGHSQPVDQTDNSSHPSQAPTTGSAQGLKNHPDMRPGPAAQPTDGKPASSSTDPKTPTR